MLPRSEPWLRATLSLGLAAVYLSVAGSGLGSVPVTQTFSDGTDGDQDDMAVWVHPTDPARSTVIAADKDKATIYVYDLGGEVIQRVSSPHPGNIDVRYGFRLGGDCVDLVAFNEREEEAIRVYRVDPAGRTLERVDDGTIATGDNYGFTLYRHRDGQLFAYSGPKSDGSVIRQYRLFADSAGRITGVPTDWRFEVGTVEGMAGDDQTGYLYLAEESAGLWRVHALDASDKTLIARVGDAGGLRADVEGVAIYYAAGGTGFIVVSSQGDDAFAVLERQPPHRRVGTFRLSGVGSTDGIDVLNMNLGPRYPQGLFTAHNGASCCPVVAARWNDIAAEVSGLLIDTDSWDPRRSNRSCEPGQTTTSGAP